MSRLEQRLERLEKALAAQEPDVLMVGHASTSSTSDRPEPIAGWRGYDGFDCPRAPF